MPKGQYPRKPRQPVEGAPLTDASGGEGYTPEQARVISEQQAAEAKPAYVETQWYEVPAAPVAPAVPAHETFDDWMDEPAPIMPSDDMVGRKVRGWAATVCPIPHEVIWSPVADSSAIEVVLSTIHGTARMRKPAGQWSEGDIDFALDAMRGDLGA